MNDAVVNPASHMRFLLEEHRRRGFIFDSAWKNSYRALPRGSGEEMKEFWDEWRAVLKWAKPFYEAGYNRWEADFTSVFVALYPTLPEQQSV